MIHIYYLATQKMITPCRKPIFSIREGVLKTVQYLKESEWVFEMRNSQ